LAKNDNPSPGSPASRPLRIAQIAPLFERVPPKLYGGTERVVSYLTEELVRRGHDVTLFASGDSVTRAKLAPGYSTALRLAGKSDLGTFLQLPMVGDVYENARARFDIIHSHIDYWSFPFAQLIKYPPTVATMHGRLDIEDLRPIYNHYRWIPAVSISDAQRIPLPFMNWVETIYHGLPHDLLSFSPGPGKYLAFLGRISPEKRPDLAIEIARKAGIQLKIAAKVDPVDRAYYEAVVEPRISPPDIEYIGEINETEKNEFLGNALALMFPIDWPEPFGLTMIESMACGTPVVARPCGSVPEIIKPGVSGIIGTTVEELVAAVAKAASLPRKGCRAEFDARFTVEVMADNYERLFRRLIAKAQSQAK
jgi:glycosyltransferase involved in cell wall biosynthesis